MSIRCRIGLHRYISRFLWMRKYRAYFSGTFYCLRCSNPRFALGGIDKCKTSAN